MKRYEVRESVDVYGPRQGARELAASIGFTRSECQELAIVVSELTSNILKYGIRGSVELDECESAQYGRGILIVASDIGPPFHDLAMAMRDGFSDRGPIDPGTLLRRGGLGTGLGAVQRLTDELEVDNAPGDKRIKVARYLKRPRRA